MINFYTTIEQSKKLLELGLSPESADMVYFYWENYKTKEHGIDDIPTVRGELPIDKFDVPCWSLAALRKLLPVGIKPDENATYLFSNHNRIDGTWVYMYAIDDYVYKQFTGSDINACYDMVVWLLENNYIDKGQ